MPIRLPGPHALSEALLQQAANLGDLGRAALQGAEPQAEGLERGQGGRLGQRPRAGQSDTVARQSEPGEARQGSRFGQRPGTGVADVIVVQVQAPEVRPVRLGQGPRTGIADAVLAQRQVGQVPGVRRCRQRVRTSIADLAVGQVQPRGRFQQR